MRFEFKHSFDKSVKSLQGQEKEEIKEVISKITELFSHNSIFPKGTGLRKLRKNYWEVRRGLKARILFRWQGDLIEFILAGDHNDIKRYLRNL